MYTDKARPTQAEPGLHRPSQTFTDRAKPTQAVLGDYTGSARCTQTEPGLHRQSQAYTGREPGIHRDILVSSVHTFVIQLLLLPALIAK